MKNENAAFDIILSPVITEKSTNLNALNKLTFKVAKDANKSSIKKKHWETLQSRGDQSEYDFIKAKS